MTTAETEHVDILASQGFNFGCQFQRLAEIAGKGDLAMIGQQAGLVAAR